MTFVDAKQRFSGRVADYVRYRPSYPNEVVTVLCAECGLRPGHTIADIGSGTGLLSELFLKNGNRVYGVEPNRDMRAAGEDYLAAWDGFCSIEGSAEATTLGEASVDFVTAGQAFHWFELEKARQEFRRILRSPGWVVAVWNLRDKESLFNQGYEDILVKYGIDYPRVRQVGDGNVRSFFLDDPFFERRVQNRRLFDCDELAGHMRSASYAPQEGHVNFAPMMEALRQLFRDHQENGRVAVNYTTHIYFGQLSGVQSNA